MYLTTESALREIAFRRYARASGQAVCPSGHEEWWLGDRRCPWCKAVV